MNHEYNKLSMSKEKCDTCKQPLPEATLSFISSEKHRVGVQKAKEEILLETAEVELNAAQSKLKKVTESINIIKENDRLKEQNPFTSILDLSKRNVLDKKIELDGYNKSLRLVQGELNKLEVWENAFGKDIKLMMFNQACPFLTEKVNEYFQHLNNNQLRLEFSTIKTLKSKKEQRAEFNVEVISNEKQIEFNSLSGGEQQIVNFAVGMALSNLATLSQEKSSILILDEPFVGLSPKNAENIIHFLNKKLRTENYSTILLISNEETLQSLIPNVISVEKLDGVTRIR
jgi:DNA repair exonuclease SbcCD ATPase subunit